MRINPEGSAQWSQPSPTLRWEWRGCQDAEQGPSGGSFPFLIPSEMVLCPAVRQVSQQWGNCYSAAVAIFIFQLSQEEQGSNIYTLAFHSERTSSQNNERRILSNNGSGPPH